MPNPSFVFQCISFFFFKPNYTLFDLIHFVYLIFKGAKKDFSSFKTTILNNNLKGREEVLTQIIIFCRDLLRTLQSAIKKPKLEGTLRVS